MTTTSGVATSASSYFDTVSLISPLIDYTGGVSVTAGDNYSLNVTGASANSTASIGLTILSINGAPAPSSYADNQYQTGSGTSSGQLSVDFTILACPCSFEFIVLGSAVAGPQTATASFEDPFFITLPPGWTYTLASQTAAAAPEPGTVVFGIGGLVLMIGLGKRPLLWHGVLTRSGGNGAVVRRDYR